MPGIGHYGRARQICCRKCGCTKFHDRSMTLMQCANPACGKFYRGYRGFAYVNN